MSSCSTNASASNPSIGRMTKKIEAPNRKKEWLRGFEDTASQVGLALMCGHFRVGEWQRGGPPNSLSIPSLHMVEKAPLGSPWGSMEEKGKLDARGTAMELLCLGPGCCWG